MTASINKENVLATKIWFEDNNLCILLSDGKEVVTPLAKFPRLQKATDKQRNNWRFIGKGRGIHWADIDEDISVAGLLKYQ
jgi:Protein of unknown function (DUF2442)